MYKRRKPRRIEASLLLSFGSTHPHSSRVYYPLLFLIKLSYNTTLSIASDFRCGETEPRKLHTPLTICGLCFDVIPKNSLPKSSVMKHFSYALFQELYSV